MPYAAAVAWIRTHQPTGLAPSASGGETGPKGPIATGYAYSALDQSDAWTQAQLEISLAPSAANLTIWRVDGIALWLDPTPLADSAAGPRIHVTVSGGCPATEARAVGVSNTGADLSGALLPAAAPTSALTCAYGGEFRPGGTLPAHRLLTQGTARTLADLGRHVERAHLDDVQAACAADDGSSTIVAFHYAGRPDVDLFEHGGCASISNGKITVQNSSSFARFSQAIAAAAR
jgi:hypothetical protein